MPADVELRWASGPKRSKAKQIPDYVWQRYEPEIRKMHTSMTLDELIAELKRTHGFEATTRQYTAQLDRWGLKKYKTKNAALEIVAEGLGEDLNSGNSSTLVTEGSKRDRTASNIDDCDTEVPDDLPSETQSAKKPRMDNEQAALHQPQVSSLAENVTATMELDGDTSTLPTQDLLTNVLHDRPKFVLSESTVRSILPEFAHRFAAQKINVDLCLRIARSIEMLHQPCQGPELSTMTETHLRVIADYLFAAQRFTEATNIYLLISESERSHKSYVPFFYTPSLVLAARAARSEENCRYIQKVLNASVNPSRSEMSPSIEQSLACTLLANLSSRLEPGSEKSVRGLPTKYLAWEFLSGQHRVADTSLYLLAYVYRKWVYHEPFLTLGLSRRNIRDPRSRPQISHADFVQFLSEGCIDALRRRDHIPQDLGRSLQWCLEAITWYRSDSQIDMKTHTEAEMFDDLWRMWHGGYSQSPNGPGWTTEGRSIGISLAEHISLCSRTIHLLLAKKPHEIYETTHAITIYLQMLYKSIDPLEVTAGNFEIELPVSEQALWPSPSTDPIINPLASPKLPYSFPAMAPSLESADSSFGRLREASKAMVIRQRRGPSYKSGTTVSIPGVDISLYGSNPSVSFLSEVFARSCSVSLSSVPRESGIGNSFSQHTETPISDEGWTKLETEVV